MVLDRGGDHHSQCAAMISIAAEIGCAAEMLRTWACQFVRSRDLPSGTTTAERHSINAVERENSELRQANEILREPCDERMAAETARPGRMAGAPRRPAAGTPRPTPPRCVSPDARLSARVTGTLACRQGNAVPDSHGGIGLTKSATSFAAMLRSSTRARG
jgi:transposase-like protein